MYRKFNRSVGLLLTVLFFLLFAGWAGVLVGTAQEEEPAPTTRPAAIAPTLSRQLESSAGTVSFLVILEQQPDPDGYLARQRLRSAPREAKVGAIYRYLTGFARVQQAPLRAWLDAHGVAYRPFYLVNAIEVWGDSRLAAALSRRADVNRLAANPQVRLPLIEEPAARQLETANPPPDPPYGIRHANAPVVWSWGIRGDGIVLASQDTGVDWTHPALQPSYRGWDSNAQTATHVYNWYDYWGTANRGSCDPNPQVPCDDGSHGTHTVGTMVGEDPRTGLIAGMAPDARWIGCRNMNLGTGTPASYIACFEFFLAPFPQNGDPETDGDSSKAPHIINNSWYCPPAEGCDYDSLRQAVQTMRTAGQLVVVSAGNNGPTCGTVRYPIGAYPEVFSVGAHNGAGTIAGFSSRGPVTVDSSGRMKPEIVAAGDGVMSTIPGGLYGNSSGTSMASPHVAGAVALLWSAAPHLIGQLDETEQILMKSATPVLNNICDEDLLPVSPNNTYGYGRLDAATAVTMALHAGSVTATVQGATGPLEGIGVKLTDLRTGAVRTGQSNSAGTIAFDRVYTGDYIVSAVNGSLKSQSLVVISPEEEASVLLTLARYYYFPFVAGE